MLGPRSICARLLGGVARSNAGLVSRTRHTTSHTPEQRWGCPRLASCLPIIAMSDAAVSSLGSEKTQVRGRRPGRRMSEATLTRRSTTGAALPELFSGHDCKTWPQEVLREPARLRDSRQFNCRVPRRGCARLLPHVRNSSGRFPQSRLSRAHVVARHPLTFPALPSDSTTLSPPSPSSPSSWSFNALPSPSWLAPPPPPAFALAPSSSSSSSSLSPPVRAHGAPVSIISSTLRSDGIGSNRDSNPRSDGIGSNSGSTVRSEGIGSNTGSTLGSEEIRSETPDRQVGPLRQEQEWPRHGQVVPPREQDRPEGAGEMWIAWHSSSDDDDDDDEDHNEFSNDGEEDEEEEDEEDEEDEAEDEEDGPARVAIHVGNPWLAENIINGFMRRFFQGFALGGMSGQSSVQTMANRSHGAMSNLPPSLRLLTDHPVQNSHSPFVWFPAAQGPRQNGEPNHVSEPELFTRDETREGNPWAEGRAPHLIRGAGSAAVNSGSPMLRGRPNVPSPPPIPAAHGGSVPIVAVALGNRNAPHPLEPITAPTAGVAPVGGVRPTVANDMAVASPGHSRMLEDAARRRNHASAPPPPLAVQTLAARATDQIAATTVSAGTPPSADPSIDTNMSRRVRVGPGTVPNSVYEVSGPSGIDRARAVVAAQGPPPPAVSASAAPAPTGAPRRSALQAIEMCMRLRLDMGTGDHRQDPSWTCVEAIDLRSYLPPPGQAEGKGTTSPSLADAAQVFSANPLRLAAITKPAAGAPVAPSVVASEEQKCAAGGGGRALVVCMSESAAPGGTWFAAGPSADPDEVDMMAGSTLHLALAPDKLSAKGIQLPLDEHRALLVPDVRVFRPSEGCRPNPDPSTWERCAVIVLPFLPTLYARSTRETQSPAIGNQHRAPHVGQPATANRSARLGRPRPGQGPPPATSMGTATSSGGGTAAGRHVLARQIAGAARLAEQRGYARLIVPLGRFARANMNALDIALRFAQGLELVPRFAGLGVEFAAPPDHPHWEHNAKSVLASARARRTELAAVANAPPALTPPPPASQPPQPPQPFSGGTNPGPGASGRSANWPPLLLPTVSSSLWLGRPSLDAAERQLGSARRRWASGPRGISAVHDGSAIAAPSSGSRPRGTGAVHDGFAISGPSSGGNSGGSGGRGAFRTRSQSRGFQQNGGETAVGAAAGMNANTNCPSVAVPVASTPRSRARRARNPGTTTSRRPYRRHDTRARPASSSLSFRSVADRVTEWWEGLGSR
jgi:hypothetical protein